MLVHQKINSIGCDIYNAFIYRNVSWYQHIHKSFELIHVLKGEIEVKLNDLEYVLKKDDFLLVPPFYKHYIKSLTDESLTFIAVFSKNYIENFASFFDNKTPKNNLFHLQDLDRQYFVEKVVGVYSDVGKIELADTVSIKEGLFVVLSEFIKQTEFINASNRTDLFYEIIDYTEKNFEKDLSLMSLSSKLGYDYRYLSKILNRNFGFSFLELVNQYRVEKAIELIKNSNASFTDISIECGFQTIRSFNRIFKSYTGKTPSEFKLRNNI